MGPDRIHDVLFSRASRHQLRVLYEEFSAAKPARCRCVFFRNVSFNTQGPVTLLQETRLASVLVNSFSVDSIMTPSTDFKMTYHVFGNPKGLMDVGLPSFKRSIVTKFSDSFDQRFYREWLEWYGRPDVESVA